MGGGPMEEWLERLLYAVVAVVAPMALLGANAVLGFGGILLTIVLIVWMGFAVVVLSPYLT